MKNLIILLIFLPFYAQANKEDTQPEEKISLFFEISMEKCTSTPEPGECVSSYDLREKREIILKRISETHSDGWLTLSKTIYGFDLKANLHIEKVMIHEKYVYGISIELYYPLDGGIKFIHFNTALSAPYNLSIMNFQGGSFGTPDLNYAPLVIFGGSHLQAQP